MDLESRAMLQDILDAVRTLAAVQADHGRRLELLEQGQRALATGLEEIRHLTTVSDAKIIDRIESLESLMAMHMTDY
jgi:hypothetical protein